MIVTWPDKRLVTECDPIEDTELAQHIEAELLRALTSGGMGLTAPQIGHMYRLFVIRGYPHAFVNPSIEYGGEWTNGNEGCLSLPGITVSVIRSKRVKVTYSRAAELSGTSAKKLSGRDARVVQHEMDHLNGVLIISDKRRP